MFLSLLGLLILLVVEQPRSQFPSNLDLNSRSDQDNPNNRDLSVEQVRSHINRIANKIDGTIKPSELEEKCYSNSLNDLVSIYL